MRLHYTLTFYAYITLGCRLCGSYGALSGGLASEAMTDFTGGIVERFNFREELPDDMLQILMKAYERHSLMSCSIEVSSNQKLIARSRTISSRVTQCTKINCLVAKSCDVIS